MDGYEVTRRAVLQGGAALAGLAALGVPRAALATFLLLAMASGSSLGLGARGSGLGAG